MVGLCDVGLSQAVRNGVRHHGPASAGKGVGRGLIARGWGQTPCRAAIFLLASRVGVPTYLMWAPQAAWNRQPILVGAFASERGPVDSLRLRPAAFRGQGHLCRHRKVPNASKEVLETLERYCRYLESPRDYVINQSLVFIFRKDRNFPVWAESHALASNGNQSRATAK